MRLIQRLFPIRGMARGGARLGVMQWLRLWFRYTVWQRFFPEFTICARQAPSIVAGVSVFRNSERIAFLPWEDIDRQYANQGFVQLPPLPRKADVLLADFFQRERRWERVKPGKADYQ